METTENGYYIGQKLLCISEPELHRYEIEWGCKAPQKNKTYTVRKILHGGTGIYLEEIVNPVNRYWGGISETNPKFKGTPIEGEPAWSVKHFKLI